MTTEPTTEDRERDLLDLARVDWLVRPGGDVLHALASGTPDVDEWRFVDGEFACGLPFLAAEVPGLFTRLGAIRCLHCCRAVGVPVGCGSPKNDNRCREVLGLPPAPQPESPPAPMRVPLPPVGPDTVTGGWLDLSYTKPPGLLASLLTVVRDLLTRRWRNR